MFPIEEGPSGFVGIDDDSLIIPDYAGNQFFNTLGNIAINPRTGLTFVDFETGGLLQLTGEAVILDATAASTLPGAERIWRFTPRSVSWREGVLPLRWQPWSSPSRLAG